MNLTRIAPPLLLLASCNSAPASPPGAESASAAPPSASSPTSVASVAPAAPPADAGAPEPAKAKHPTVTLPPIAWTKTPKLADAPATVAVGDIHGMHVELPLAEVRRFMGDWTLWVGEAKAADPERQVVILPLKGPPATGAKLAAAYGRTYATIHIVKPEGNDTMSHSGDNAYAVEFTSVEMKPYDKARKGSQIVGKAKGRVIVMYDSIDSKTSWVAGTFEAPIEMADENEAPTPTKKKR